MSWLDSAKEKEWADSPHWKEIYRTIWPDDFVEATGCDDPDWQRLGVDRFVKLKTGVVRIQEKNRPTWPLEDVAIEYEHRADDGHITPGWIERVSHAQFFAYACHADKRAFVCRYSDLRAAWVSNRSIWIAGPWCKQSRENNRDYVTLFVTVPLVILCKVISKWRIIPWEHADWIIDCNRERARIENAGQLLLR